MGSCQSPSVQCQIAGVRCLPLSANQSESITKDNTNSHNSLKSRAGEGEEDGGVEVRTEGGDFCRVVSEVGGVDGHQCLFGGTVGWFVSPSSPLKRRNAQVHKTTVKEK